MAKLSKREFLKKFVKGKVKGVSSDEKPADKYKNLKK